MVLSLVKGRLYGAQRLQRLLRTLTSAEITMSSPIKGTFGRANRQPDSSSHTFSHPRRSPRLLWTAPATIHAEGRRHVGLVRDFSSDGIGVFSDFCPKPGTSIELSIRVPNSNGTILCSGKVVRVDAGASGGATRIGVSLDSCAIETADFKERQAVSIPDALQVLCTSRSQNR